MIALYVDDILIAGSRLEVDSFKLSLQSQWNIVDLGQAKFILGMELQRNRLSRTLLLHQSGKIRDLLLLTGMSESPTTSIPLHPELDLSSSAPMSTPDDLLPLSYRSIIGKLLHLVQGTRPDICYAVGKLSRSQISPSSNHFTGIRQVLRYLKGTLDLGICLGGFLDNTKLHLEAFADADWAMDVDSRRSTTGVLLRINSAPISWSSRLQRSVALSSTEAEFYSMADAASSILHTRRLLEQSGFPQDPTVLHNDNKSAIALILRHRTPSRQTKHIDVRKYWIRDVITNQFILLKYLPTEAMLADIFTKALPKTMFIHLRNSLCMIQHSVFSREGGELEIT
jgi:hypothetical protein